MRAIPPRGQKKGELTVIYENKISEDFRRKQEAEEWKL